MAAPLTFGTAFASAGFTVDPNFSPNNQQFVNAVLAVCGRAGLPFGFEAANVVLAGPAAGVAALPTYRAIVTADLPATVGTVLGVDAVMGGAGTSCGVWTNQHITTVGTATLTLNAFNGTLAGLVPSSSGGSTNYLRADGSFAQPPGTATGSVTGVNAVMAGAGTSCGTWSNQLITTAGTSTLKLNAFNGTLAGLVPSSAGGTVNYLRADGSYAQPPGTTVGANPTVAVALTATNGVATTFMRSDASPALDVTISPSWSGLHIFSSVVQAGPTAPQSTTRVSARSGGNSYEFGHSNSAGYGSNIGAEAGSGRPFLAFNAEAGTTSNTYKTSGVIGRVLQSNLLGGLISGRIATASADNQSITVDLSITPAAWQFGNATDNPSYSFLGTGIAAFTGSVACQGTGVPLIVGTSTAYAWGTGTKYPIMQLAGVGSLYGTATTGVVLTGGGLYYNGTNFIYGQAGTGVIASLGTGSFTVSCVNTSGTASGTATPTVVFSIGGTVTSNKIQGYGPVAAALVDMTPDTGTFNGTLASVTTVITCPCVWARSGNVVILAIGTGTGTSNANDFTLGGLPAAITPTRTQRLEVPDYAVENSGAIGAITTDVELIMNTNGTMTFLNGGTATGWGATLFKGVAAMFTVPYILN